jgi:hypothetical protein
VKYSDRQRFSLIAIWIFLTLTFHLGWEIIQLPYYSLWNNGTYQSISSAVLHCTFGDGLIAAAIWIVISLLLHNGRWLLTDIKRGSMLASPLGPAYTAWSEWHNVYVLGSWRYADSMPTIGGIGLLPLLQWALVPPITWILFRIFAKRVTHSPLNAPHF